jgi:hypothetical protein
MLSILDGNAATYQKWAEEYYDRTLSAEAVKRIYAGIPIASDLVRELNPAIKFEDILADVTEIGFPHS